LGGSLLNLSYGTGRIFVVPNEEVGGLWQGAVCELPLPAFATGIMRGRFAADGALYTCGMFAWAGNATSPGGFHRVRATGAPSFVPQEIHAQKGGFALTLSDSVDPSSVQAGAFALETWGLKRTANYGSDHYNTKVVPIKEAKVSGDGRTITLNVPELAPTDCYQLKFRLKGADGAVIERSLHGTIHRLGE
jgi:hypothetical protein